MIGGRILKAALAFVVLSGAVMPRANANAQSFDGITIIELADEAGWQAITGYRLSPVEKLGGVKHIITFVSARGSYAAVGNTKCVAWAAPGTYTGSSITFGIPASTASIKVVRPKICQPFTLTYGGSGMVRVDVRGTKFHKSGGPLSKNARIMNYSRQRKVIAHIPLVALDWGLPAFTRHDIKGVRLGPLPVVTASLKGRAKIKIGKVRRSPLGIRRNFEANLSKQPGQAGLIRVGGYIAPKGALGWPWDALYVAWFGEILRQRSMTEAFDQAIVERYGAASLKRLGEKVSSQVSLFWAYDLKGQKLTAATAAPDNCLGTFEHWRRDASLSAFNRDIGPWGCALVMVLTHDGKAGTVRKYRVEALSGYTLALNHFSKRLEDLREAKRKIQEIESTKPKL